jgi:hypothetical protein
MFPEPDMISRFRIPGNALRMSGYIFPVLFSESGSPDPGLPEYGNLDSFIWKFLKERFPTGFLVERCPLFGHLSTEAHGYDTTGM